MVNWKHTIDYTKHVRDFQMGSINIKEMCVRLHQQLFCLNLYREDEKFTDLVDQLEMIIDPEMTVEEYDVWLDDLYDWANYDHTAWIQPT